MSPKPLRPLVATAATVLAIAIVAGLYLFQPWRVFTNRTVVEALPVAAAPASTTQPPTTPAPTTPVVPTSAPTAPAVPTTPAQPSDTIVELGRGELISHEHDTSGTARLLQLPDGSRVLRLEGLDTSDGPDLHVWLTDAPVIDGRDGWFVFDDGRHIDLGSLKGNRGDQNYEIPAGTDLSDLTSVSVWCQRFAVSFGAAPLTATS